eukprot:jgi/Mesvir1/26127/Mv06841-RA.1
MLQDTPAFAPLNMEFLGKELESIKTRVEKLPHGIWQWYFPPDTIKPNEAFFAKVPHAPEEVPEEWRPLPWPSRADISALREHDAAPEPPPTQEEHFMALVDAEAVRVTPLVDRVLHDGHTQQEWAAEDRAMTAKVAYLKRMQGVEKGSAVLYWHPSAGILCNSKLTWTPVLFGIIKEVVAKEDGGQPSIELFVYRAKHLREHVAPVEPRHCAMAPSANHCGAHGDPSPRQTSS